MSNSPLLSREWCDLVFEGRNKEYGAYVLRKQMGRRYRLVAMIMGTFFLGLAILGGIFGVFLYRAIKRTEVELEHVVKLKPLEAEKGFVIKRLSAGRAAPQVKTTPGASEGVPEVVDRETVSAPIGVDGPEQETITTPETLVDADPHHNADQLDLPIEGPQLTATEIVEEMPMYPGGLHALMKFLDENVVYSGAAQRRKVEGEVRVSFVVNTDGTISDILVDKSLDSAVDRAVVNAVRRMPKWQPGRSGGLPTPVKITLPVQFRLK